MSQFFETAKMLNAIENGGLGCDIDYEKYQLNHDQVKKVLEAIENTGGRVEADGEFVFNEKKMEFNEFAFRYKDGFIWWEDKHFKHGQVTYEEHKELFDKVFHFFEEMRGITDICEYANWLEKHKVQPAAETEDEMEEAMGMFTFISNNTGPSQDAH